MPAWEETFLQTQRVAHLATLDREGNPHVVPIVFSISKDRLYTPIDEKPKSVGADQLQRVRNIRGDSRVAVIVDRYDEDWRRLAWVQLRGTAMLLKSGEDYERGIATLMKKYPQYRSLPLHDRPVIRVTVARQISWRAGEA